MLVNLLARSSRLSLSTRPLLTQRFASTSSNQSSQLFPPEVTSLRALGKFQSQYPQAHPVIFNKMKSFYQNVPKGPGATVDVTNLGVAGRYYQRYFSRGNESKTPLLHFIAFVVSIGVYLGLNYTGMFLFVNG